ncbi:MAG: proton-translocating NADH-quinone oxidoreductase, chain [Gaiellaceae bacterium]|jgi:NADH-quinone oxidoreductase subunit L|nr:proton-translocating NADH-quinone oxidoreductase, chain [Gaiellaceae bacterium]
MIAGAWVCLLSPLAGAVAITLAGGRISRRTAGWISTLTTFVAFGGALIAFFGLWGEGHGDREHISTAYTWLESGDFEVEFQILVDTLSSTMMLIVSGVGGLIVWYSMGYLAGDDEERRYFAYMSLFVFSMLLLVQAGNFLLLLAGWGLVGLASYLLIGFWHHKPEAVAAAKKAFVMNAIGDATLALGLVLLVWETGTLEYLGVFEDLDSLSTTTVNLVAVGLLGGAVAKSAQIPLHTWLPDAMEGPTPVSALIHAATMVTAGVYLLVRASPVFEAAPDVQHLAAILGAITLLVAGVVALVQWDIKRVIAYSTMSQIGYMFVAAGIGAYGYALFHLMTHAFFKALLFMSAGVVIHHLGGEQDIRRMGGLRSVMPRTHLAFLVGGLSLAGIPIFAGFWSKDGIVAAAFASGDTLGYTLWVAGLVGALLTGAYTFRLYFTVFRGEPSELVTAQAHEGHGEGPLSMLIPVGVLSVLATIGGLVVIPGVWEPFLHWIDETAEPLVMASVAEDYGTSAIAVTLALIGAGLAHRAFRSQRQVITNPRIWHVLEHKLYFDELYDALFYRPSASVSNALRRNIEEPVVERSLDEIGSGTIQVGGEVGRVQSGLLRTYAVAIAFSVAVLVVVFVAVR